MKWITTKPGYEVRLSDGNTRGVYRDRKTAELIASLATVMEFLYFDRITVVSVRIPRWKRYGTRTTA